MVRFRKNRYRGVYYVDKDQITEVEEVKEKEEKETEYEDICYICRRPESRAGKMLHIPQNICICVDCMQRTFDTMGGAGLGAEEFMMDPGFSFGGTSDSNEEEGKKKGKMPSIHFLNLNDFSGMNSIPKSQKIKKNKEKKKEKPVFDIKNIPAPHKIKEQLDQYVVGQEQAKKVMSVAVYNHYKRITRQKDSNVEIEKSNMLMIGPTGCGKTYLVKTLAKLLDVPLAITDATSLTEAGYIGDDIESVVSKLLATADNDVERAEHGIIFVDEIDKIAKKKNANQRDVSGESVQQGMLKLLEGAEVEVPVGANSKNAMVPLVTVNTKDILFICGGAFPEMENVIKERLNKSSSMGFMADLKDKYDNDRNILHKVTVDDVRNFGMIPEFIGRLPVLFALDALDEDMMVRILKEPKNAIIKQYEELLAMDEVKLTFTDEAMHEIAKKAMEKKIGARALRAVIEEFMLDIMYETPKDDNIGEVIITEGYLNHTGGPEIKMREFIKLDTKTPELEDGEIVKS